MGVLPADEIGPLHRARRARPRRHASRRWRACCRRRSMRSSMERGLICPAAQGGEAAWAGGLEVLAPPNLLALINHFKGTQVLAPPQPRIAEDTASYLDLRDIKGQETAKRALEVAAAGGHNLLMVGPPGAGKSMLAARLPGLLPPLDPAEALEVEHDPFGRRAARRRQADAPAPVPRSASLGLAAGAGRRRSARQAGRGVAGASRRAVPRRAAGIPARHPGGAAPADRDRPRRRWRAPMPTSPTPRASSWWRR